MGRVSFLVPGGIDRVTGGSSGGPWVVGLGGGNYVNSVTSYGYSSLPGVLFGPYFGDGAINLYNTTTPR